MPGKFTGIVRLASALFALSVGLVAAVVAQAPPDAKNVGDVRGNQEKNAELFKQFQKDLLALAQKLDRSERPEDKERAKVLFAALDLSRKQGIDNQFQQLIAGVGKGNATTKQLDDIVGQDQQLRAALQEILNILMTDDEATRLKKEIAKLEAYLKEAKQIRQNQETIRAMTEAKRVDEKRISKNQKDVADRTKDLADRMSGKEKNSNPEQNKSNEKNGKQGGESGEEATPKSAPKPEAKSGDQAAEAKNDAESPDGDAKPNDGSAEQKPGPDGKPMDGSTGETKPMSKGTDPKEAASDKPKPGPDAGSPREGEPKGGEPKGGEPKGGEPKGGEPKGGEPKGGEPKGGEPKGGEPKGGEPKGGQPKGGEPKGGEPNGGEPKGGEPKSGQPKGGEPKGGKEPKSQDKGAKKPQAPSAKGKETPAKGDKAGDGKGIQEPKDQQGSQKPAGQPSGGQPPQGGGQSQQPQQPQPPGEQTPGRKQIQEAYPHQEGATEDLKKNDRENAAKKEDKAIEEISKAIQELEKKLKQLREEEMLKLLANLEARTNRMLAMQVEVYESTKNIDNGIKSRKGEKTTADIQKSQQQSDKEGEIISEANKALKLLETEGSAVAFARVLEEVREDMLMVQRRLTDARVEKDTQVIEENIIAMLKEMAAALKKAQQEMQDQQQQQQQQQQQKKPGNQDLINLIAELKLIRSMQAQVNSRTKNYGEQSQAEQAKDPLIQSELRTLAARQAKLQDMVNKIASGSNK